MDICPRLCVGIADKEDCGAVATKVPSSATQRFVVKRIQDHSHGSQSGMVSSNQGHLPGVRLWDVEGTTHYLDVSQVVSWYATVDGA